MNRVVGTPEQIADRLEEWPRAGVGGINTPYCTTPGSFRDFIDGVTPVLQERGLQQSEYARDAAREAGERCRRGPPVRHPSRRQDAA